MHLHVAGLERPVVVDVEPAGDSPVLVGHEHRVVVATGQGLPAFGDVALGRRVAQLAAEPATAPASTSAIALMSMEGIILLRPFCVCPARERRRPFDGLASGRDQSRGKRALF